MLTLNGKNSIYSGAFSIKAGDEVTLSAPGLSGRVFRFTTVENAPSTPTGTNLKFVNNEVWVPIPLLDVGQRAVEIDPIYREGSESVSIRIVLIGAGEFTSVLVELHRNTAS